MYRTLSVLDEFTMLVVATIVTPLDERRSIGCRVDLEFCDIVVVRVLEVVPPAEVIAGRQHIRPTTEDAGLRKRRCACHPQRLTVTRPTARQ